jgi:hypothetical protein
MHAVARFGVNFLERNSCVFFKRVRRFHGA